MVGTLPSKRHCLWYSFIEWACALPSCFRSMQSRDSVEFDAKLQKPFSMIYGTKSITCVQIWRAISDGCIQTLCCPFSVDVSLAKSNTSVFLLLKWWMSQQDKYQNSCFEIDNLSYFTIYSLGILCGCTCLGVTYVHCSREQIMSPFATLLVATLAINHSILQPSRNRRRPTGSKMSGLRTSFCGTRPTL